MEDQTKNAGEGIGPEWRGDVSLETRGKGVRAEQTGYSREGGEFLWASVFGESLEQLPWGMEKEADQGPTQEISLCPSGWRRRALSECLLHAKSTGQVT